MQPDEQMQGIGIAYIKYILQRYVWNTNQRRSDDVEQSFGIIAPPGRSATPCVGRVVDIGGIYVNRRTRTLNERADGETD